MKVAVIERNMSQYVANIFKLHMNLDMQISCLIEWDLKPKTCNEVLSKLKEGGSEQYDVILIAIKENNYLSRLLTYLHNNLKCIVYIIRLYAMETNKDFIGNLGNCIFDPDYVDKFDLSNERSYLVHLETHVCDHCNLNCKACNNFSPFVRKPQFTDVEQFEFDLKRISNLFSQIGRFFLLGGEPLLAPKQCCDMIKVYRKYYPQNELRVLTNAILIFDLKEDVWRCFRENNVIIHISLYPPLKSKKEEIEKKLRQKNVKYLIHHEVDFFLKHWTLYPFEDEYYNLSICGSAGCHYLREGELAKCPDAILIGNMKEELKSKDIISLENVTMNSWDIIDRLNAPIDLCKKCSFERAENVKWEQVDSSAQYCDWLIKNKYEYENDRLKEQIVLSQKQLERLNNESKQKEIFIEECNRKINSLHEDKENASITIKQMIQEKEMKQKEVEELMEKYVKTNEEVERLMSSWSYKSGRVLTYLPRKFRKVVRMFIERLDE